MKVTSAAHTDRGKVRRENQDSYGLNAAIGLYLVADGMGGHAGGKRASEEAARTLEEALADRTGDHGGGAERLRAAVTKANERVWQLAEADPALHGMGTTLVAVLVEGDVAHLAHVGDSRAYRIRDGAIARLTRDHSYLAELAEQGVDVPDARVRAHYESLLTRAVGVGPSVEVDVATERLVAGDTWVLCSDGVYRMIPPPELLALVLAGGEDLAATCATIVERANAAGGPDNSTVVVLRAEADDGDATVLIGDGRS